MRNRSLNGIQPGTSFRYDFETVNKVFAKIGKECNLNNIVCYIKIDPILKLQAYQMLAGLEGYTMSDLLNDCLQNYLDKCAKRNLRIDTQHHSFSQIIDQELKEWLNLEG
jgi:antitoxin component of RelBE/YafQ-DinJ toxin-antitoxin module